MTKILIVSDTHNDDAWLNLMANTKYDAIIHCGDHLMKNEIALITKYYVDGNNDWGSKNLCTFVLDKLKFLVIHGDEQHLNGNDKNNIRNKLENIFNNYDFDVLLFGHTHIPYLDNYKNKVIINPGSMHYSRHDFKKHYIDLIVHEGKILDLQLHEYH